MGSYFTTQEFKMKLFIAALATVNASVVCPTGWTAGTDATTADDCSPDDVTVTCNSDSMSVKFPIDAVYYEGSVELSSDQLDAEEATGTGEYTFTMTTVDKDDVTIDSSNAAEIGEAITLKVSPNASLPSNVEFQLIDCTAVSEFDTDNVTPVSGANPYNILENGSCVSDLLDAQFVTGRSDTEVGLSFNSFTFEAADDSLGLVCNVKLCLTTDDACNNEAQMMTADNLTNFSCNTKYTRSDWWNGIQ